MADVQPPKYVTDGKHIYLWHEEYAQMLEQGKLKESPPPTPKEAGKNMTHRQHAKLEEARKKALKEAEEAVALFKAPIAPAKLEDVFGAPPKEE